MQPLALPPSHEPLDQAGGLGILQRCMCSIGPGGGRRGMCSVSAVCAPRRTVLGRGDALSERKSLTRCHCGALRAVARPLPVAALDDGLGVARALIQDHAFDGAAFDGSGFAQIEAPFSGRRALRAMAWALAVASLDHGRCRSLLGRCAKEFSCRHHCFERRHRAVLGGLFPLGQPRLLASRSAQARVHPSEST